MGNVIETAQIVGEFIDKIENFNETKQSIKTAIENKGQDLSGVPFTGYAEKIEAIQSGGQYEEVVIALVNRNTSNWANAFYCCSLLKEIPVPIDTSKATNINNMFAECSQLVSIPQIDTKNVTSMSSTFAGCTSLTTIPEIDTSNVTSMLNTFNSCKSLTAIPKLNIGKVTSLRGTFNSCESLTTIPELDTSSVLDMGFAFYACKGLVSIPQIDTSKVDNMQTTFDTCSALTTIPPLDIRNVTNASSMFKNCASLTVCLLRNIKVNLQVGSGTNWGTKLTQESALHLCKECIQDRDNAHTITFATPVYNNLETLYVRQITVTDEMRAEDDLIDKKRPFELCASTDDGAMTIANYMTLKNWAIAK